MPPVLATLLSATLNGIAGRVVRVEVDVAPGLPGFTIVGLPDAALSEARERVRGALRNAGFHHPPRRITVNLAPAELRKAGASLDLAIAIGILLGSEQLRAGPGRIALIGELGLGGEVRRVPGVLPMVPRARRGAGSGASSSRPRRLGEAPPRARDRAVPRGHASRRRPRLVRSARSRRAAPRRCRARASPGVDDGGARRGGGPVRGDEATVRPRGRPRARPSPGGRSRSRSRAATRCC